jgi:endonuclease-8
MPEGDTVWNTAQLLHGALAGATITHSDFRVPALATVDLSGSAVRECASRGKHLLIRLTGPGDASAMTLHSHLRMDGSWRIHSPEERWHGRGSHLIRVVLRTIGSVAVGYHLHDLALVPSADEDRLVGHLGPDLLGSTGAPGGWDADEAVRRLRGDPDRTIAEALVDQRNLAGIGNMYKSELLFLRGLWPWTPTSRVDNLEAVVTLTQRLLTANRGRWTQSTTGSLRRGKTSYVYGRRGEPCRRCGTLIEKAEQDDRVTYWCPICQPQPPAEG